MAPNRHARRLSRRALLLGALAICALVVAGVVLDTVIDAGELRTLEPTSPADVHVVESFSGGTEDVVFRANGREVFVSAPNFNDASRPGGLFLVDVERRTLRNVTPAEWLAPGKLQPHGLDLWHGAEGERLFVVNHPGGSALPSAAGQSGDEATHSVEIFDVADDGSLRHARTVTHELLLSPNDVAAVGAGAFYVTNDHGYASGLMRTLEDYARLRAGSVVFVDASADGPAVAKVVRDDTLYANGIQTSADGRDVYLAETTARTLTWLRRDPSTNELRVVSRHDTGSGVDNVDVAPDGSLWVAGHPKLLTFVAHSKDPRHARAPSEVLRLVPGERQWTQTVVYLSEGDPLSASSVAASNGAVVVVGAVFDARVMLFSAP